MSLLEFHPRALTRSAVPSRAMPDREPIELVTRKDLQRMLGLSQSEPERLFRRGLLPPVFATLNGQPLWRREVMEAFARNTPRRTVEEIRRHDPVRLPAVRSMAEAQ